MCGISGQLRFDGQSVDKELVRRMTRSLRHRGPDGVGHYFGPKIGMGHRRLAIIDLKRGQQPMLNAEKSLCLVANNEIYNYRELKSELQAAGYEFQTTSDTEVILKLFQRDGEESFRQLEGMFALALWDAAREILFLARDPFGIKPLYYYYDSSCFIFASELKALLQYAKLDRELNLEALDSYFGSLALPEPHSIFRKVRKLPAGHFLKVQNGKVRLQSYWQPLLGTFAQRDDQQNTSFHILAKRFRQELQRTVSLSMRSDVPVGVLLSGGVDSSTITALAAGESGKRLHTFSAAFAENEFDESAYSELVAKHFGTRHHRILVTKTQATRIAEKLVGLIDEPFADSSSIPTYAVCQLASEHVKTVLSGEGADELLGGYPWHTGSPSRQVFDERVLAEHPARVVFKSSERSQLYSQDWTRSLKKLRLKTKAQNPDNLSALNAALLDDLKIYLPSDILFKSDRVSMIHSLEVRVPFLNHEFAQWAMSLPEKMKVNGSIKKVLLKRSMARVLPKTVIERGKKGFSIPMDVWLWEKGAWRELIYDTIFSQRTRERGQLEIKVLEKLQHEHERLERLHGYKLWTVFVFEMWQRAFLDRQ
jgi:asparagine synthase (glutamine-hydrolysing)